MPSKTKILDGKKRCGHCKNMLPVSEFNACKHAATGFRSQCKRCMKDQREKMRPYYQGWRKQGTDRSMNYQITTRTPDGLWRYSLETPTGLVTGAIAADSKGQAKRKVMPMQKQVLKRAGGGTTPLNKKQARKLAKEVFA